jgi:Zn-dependent protease
MIRLETAQLIQELIAYLIAYFPTVTLAGYAEARLAKKFGDKTPEYAGFLTLNPLVHMDPLGIALVTLPPHFGFGKRMPMDLDNIQKKHNSLKLLMLFMSRAITHILIIFILIFSYYIFSKTLLTSGAENNLNSTFHSILLIFQALINLNILSVVIYFIIGLVRTCIPIGCRFCKRVAKSSRSISCATVACAQIRTRSFAVNFPSHSEL